MQCLYWWISLCSLCWYKILIYNILEKSGLGIFLHLYKQTNAIMTAGKGYSLTDSMSKTYFRCGSNMWVLNFIKENPFGFPHFSSRCLIQGNFFKRKWKLLFFFQLSLSKVDHLLVHLLWFSSLNLLHLLIFLFHKAIKPKNPCKLSRNRIGKISLKLFLSPSYILLHSHKGNYIIIYIRNIVAKPLWSPEAKIFYDVNDTKKKKRKKH